jgi:hypothetical protein
MSREEKRAPSPGGLPCGEAQGVRDASGIAPASSLQVGDVVRVARDHFGDDLEEVARQSIEWDLERKTTPEEISIWITGYLHSFTRTSSPQAEAEFRALRLAKLGEEECKRIDERVAAKRLRLTREGLALPPVKKSHAI